MMARKIGSRNWRMNSHMAPTVGKQNKTGIGAQLQTSRPSLYFLQRDHLLQVAQPSNVTTS